MCVALSRAFPSFSKWNPFEEQTLQHGTSNHYHQSMPIWQFLLADRMQTRSDVRECVHNGVKNCTNVLKQQFVTCIEKRQTVWRCAAKYATLCWMQNEGQLDALPSIDHHTIRHTNPALYLCATLYLYRITVICNSAKALAREWCDHTLGRN